MRVPLRPYATLDKLKPEGGGASGCQLGGHGLVMHLGASSRLRYFPQHTSSMVSVGLSEAGKVHHPLGSNGPRDPQNRPRASPS